MDNKELFSKIKEIISEDRIKQNEPMKNHTSIKIGGEAEFLVKISTIEELKKILELVKKQQIPFMIIGNGSNILILDKGIKGITLKIQIEKIEIQEKNGAIQITVGAGEKLGKLAQIAKQKQISRIRRVISVYQEP